MSRVPIEQNNGLRSEQDIIDYLNYQAINQQIPYNININNNYNFINSNSLNDIFESDYDSESDLSSFASDSDSENNSYINDKEVEEQNNFNTDFIKIIKLQNNKKQNCVICQDKLCKEQEVYILPCSHIFHAKCISTWLNKKQECAICRTDTNIKDYFMDKIEQCNNLDDLKKKLTESIKIIKKTQKIIKKVI